MNMKKVLAGILSASLVLTLAACSGGSGTTSASGGEASAEAGTGEAAPAASKLSLIHIWMYSVGYGIVSLLGNGLGSLFCKRPK